MYSELGVFYMRVLYNSYIFDLDLSGWFLRATSWSRVTSNDYVRAETREWRVLPWNNAYEVSFVAWHPVQRCTLADPTVASTFLFRLLRSTLLPSFSCVRSSILSSLRFSSSLLLPFSLCPLLLLILRG